MSDRARLDWSEARARLAAAGERLAKTPEALDRILRERAARLARPPETAAGESRSDMLVIVRVGVERFAIPLSAVTEVVRNPQCAAIPLAPPVVAGVLQVRGEVVPVVQLSRVVSLPDPAPKTALTALLARRGARRAALLVEAVEDIRPADPNERRAAPPGKPHVMWMTGDLIPVLDPDRIFPEEMA
jgi:purine-binding chemotaxis protein CheW